ncbi:MAG: YdeI/OmpD-associated family protein [Planctomycetota bacterium]|nr:YdeI/OmpD-associated family protein [Planctomycetota bacterium]
MKNTNPEVDRYIESAAEFAQPILVKVRALFHKACPAIEETIKWRVPHFVSNGIVGCMVVYKNHASFGFWKAAELTDPSGQLKQIGATQMGSIKLTSIDDLPADKIIVSWIKEHVKLNEQNKSQDAVEARKAAAKPKKKAAEAKVPVYLAAALKKNAAAARTFAKFSPSKRKDYIEWLTSAKQESTRESRLATTIEWLSEGKSRNWKYEC